MDKQSLILIAMELDLPSILNFCNTSKKIDNSICKNDFFWINKLKKDYNFIFTHIKQRYPKEYYKLLYRSVNIDNNFDPNKGLNLAALFGYEDLVKYFLEKGAINLEKAAIKAIRADHINVLDILIPKIIREETFFDIYDLKNISSESKNMKKFIVSRYKKYLIKKIFIDLTEAIEDDNKAKIKNIVDNDLFDFKIYLDYNKENILNFIKDNYLSYF